MNNSFVIIDGSSILNSCYFATMPKSVLFTKNTEEKKALLLKLEKNNKGLYINGVKAMLRVIFKLLREQQPKYLAITWDITRNTFRRDIYPEYKGNRTDPDKQLIEQFKTMQDICKLLGISQFYDDKHEADDYIGSLSKKFENKVPTYIYTKDRDALQLVSDRTKLWLITENRDCWFERYGIDKEFFNIPHNAFEFNPSYVKEIYGVYPEEIVDLKALIGDAGDNIPGVKGVGETSAIPLINHYSNIEKIYRAIEDLTKEDAVELKQMWKEELEIKRSPINMLLKDGAKEKAELSKKLGKIITDIEINKELNDLSAELDVINIEKILKEYGIDIKINI